jgi:hypothetical protein
MNIVNLAKLRAIYDKTALTLLYTYVHTMNKQMNQQMNQPSGLPASQPTDQPANQSTSQPASQPTNQPINQPASQPANQPTNQPTNQPHETHKKLTVSQEVKKFPTFYQTHKITMTFKKPATCPYPEPDTSSQCPSTLFETDFS